MKRIPKENNINRKLFFQLLLLMHFLNSQSHCVYVCINKTFRSIYYYNNKLKDAKMSNTSANQTLNKKAFIPSEQKTFQPSLNIFDEFRTNQDLNQDHEKKKNKKKQMNTCDYSQSSQERNSMSDKSWSLEQKKNDLSRANKNHIKNKPKRSSINTISSNSVRDIRLCLKNLFKSNHNFYQKILNFQKKHQIKSQIWGLDAFIIMILHSKDITHQVTEQKYTTLLNLLISKLQAKKQTTKQNQNKQRLVCYIQHIQMYKLVKFTQFWDLQFQGKLQKFFKQIVSRRRIQVNNSMKKISYILEKLRQGVPSADLQQMNQEQYVQQSQKIELIEQKYSSDQDQQNIEDSFGLLFEQRHFAF